MIKHFLILLLLTLSFATQAEINETPDTETGEEKNWWQKRQHRDDIFYPHKAHMDNMMESGDSCMLCHPFSKNNIHDEKKLKPLNQINNEPLQAICHDCHVEKITAPSECRLCHRDPSTIWPQNHNHYYKNSHAQDARDDQESCGQCHKQLSFCTDCHFRRNSGGGFSGTNVHKLGYRSLHGLDARIAPATCGSCHQSNYCSDCHSRNR